MKWQQILAIAFKYTDDHGGGGGGDYDQLTNRPVLNGTTISGNKTSGDYNLYNKVEVQNLLEQKQDKLVQETQGAPTDEDLVSHVTTAGNNTVRTFGNIWKWIVSKATTTLYERDDQIPTSKAVVQELGTKVDKKTTGGKSVYGHNGSLQGEYAIADTLEESTPPTDIPSVALIQAEEAKFVKRETAGGTKLYGHNGDVEKSWAVVPNAWGTSTDDQILTAKGAYLQNFYLNATRFQEDVTFTDLDDMLTKMELTGTAPMYKMGYTNKWNTLPTSDRPFNMAAVYVEVLRRDSNTFILRVTDWLGDRVIERGKTNGTWGNWVDVSKKSDTIYMHYITTRGGTAYSKHASAIAHHLSRPLTSREFCDYIKDNFSETAAQATGNMYCYPVQGYHGTSASGIVNVDGLIYNTEADAYAVICTNENGGYALNLSELTVAKDVVVKVGK